MSIASSQRRIFLELHAELSPHLRSDPRLPARIEESLRARRNLGSRDRRLYRELLYTLLRHLPWLENLQGEELAGRLAALCAETPATRAFKAELSAPEGLEALPREKLLPEWLRDECPEAFEPEVLKALLGRAPLWLRLQGADPEIGFGLLNEAGFHAERSPLLPRALRLPGDTDVTRSEAYEQGRVEVQDLGSQLLLEACAIAPGGKWFDACAGAGGKTLQLSGMLGGAGRIDAHDVRPAALRELAERAQRAGIPVGKQAPAKPDSTRFFAPLRLMNQPEGLYDGVLVDAPCSGSGTWRRSPHLKWCSTPESVAKVAGLQQSLLQRYSRVVKPGGLLLFATCSICRSENEANVKAFLSACTDFEPAPLARTFDLAPKGSACLRLLPGPLDNDGLFLASFRRKS